MAVFAGLSLAGLHTAPALAWPLAPSAAVQDEKAVAVTFDHAKNPSGATRTVRLSAWQKATITISETCPADFTYDVYQSPKDTASVRASRESATGEETRSIVHDPQYGSYTVVVRRVATAAKECAALPDLALFTLAVDDAAWEIGEDAALIYSQRRDTSYTTIPAAAAPTKRLVIEDPDGHEPGRIAFASLTHFYIPRGRGLRTGPVAGFSILTTEGNKTEYYFGWGVGLGPATQRLNLAAGAAYGPRQFLPSGISVNDTVDDASAIAPLRAVYGWKFFFGITSTLFKAAGGAPKPPAPLPNGQSE